MQANDHDRARDALQSLDPSCDRGAWVKTGMAFHAAGGDFDSFDQWSAGADSYNAQAARATWRSFKAARGGVGAGALFGMARDAGWTEGNPSPRPAPAKSTPKPVEPRKPAPGMAAAEVWGRCTPATNQHGYIVKKQGNPEGLRVVPAGDPLRIMGESMAGALVVPCMAANGCLSTLQLIPPPEVAARLKAAGKPGKMNLPGCKVEGWFTVGNIVPGGIVYVVEGIGQAWACWKSTGAAGVVCFGAGNMGKVAAALRQSDAAARLVLVPDRGKEQDAHKIAAQIGCAVACLPESEPDNFDVNDLFCRDGFDVLAALLEGATEPPKPEPKVHPLARYVDIDGTAKPPRWVIPGFIGHGVAVISGAHGVGKTTALLPLALTAAGLHGDDLLPRQWRHVIYCTEDVEQARRILAGITLHSTLNIGLDLVRERVHIVEAVRLDPAFVASVGTTYREQFTRTVQGVEVLPLVVLDTKSAVLAVESENDNSEASRMMAALKQGFDGLPVWLVGHVAKANLSRNDALTSRGASAIEADANQTLFLIREGESRYLVQGKTRFESRWPELEIVSYTAQTVEPDEFGNMETVLLRWGIAAPAQQSRKEAAEQAAEQRRKEDEATMRQDIRGAVQVAWMAGNPLNRAGVKAKVRSKTSDVVATLENLLSERWLHEVTVPAKERTNNSKAAYLVNLTTEEHEAVIADGGLPADKLVIPASWQKQAIPVVPAPGGDAVEVNHAEQ
ncbi:AAA family ATPase [Rhodoferax sp.]|uniref:AAA family ATPase n=1 Tax=Rhodoferax sp. TaxID=50421 RepID=UPI0026130C62|nr:AAA family ATPase [Rhodoferax sp.]MDD5001774.1 AAA family ATPase [Thiomonas arsenitoxydans]MDD5478493.1 AAA family ATPase [Rhodoferax sp.]